jgi:Cu/Ag efflux protein CusF
MSMLLAVAVAGALPAAAQQPGARPASAAPCCGITAIDVRTGVVTAQEASTGHVFRFQVQNRALLRGLKVGQRVWADFAAARVRVNQEEEGEEPCCRILAGGSAGLDQPAAAAPCCGITAIDAATGLVTARLTANGRTFQFRVTDKALLASLKLGDKVWASGATRRAGLTPVEPCCNIVGPLPAGMP